MKDLRVSLCQNELMWHDWPANAERFDEQLSKVSADTDLIILPEMFGSGFTMTPAEVAQTMDGEAVSWMHEKSEQTGAVVIGSLVIEDGGKYFNRLIAAFPGGERHYYDKRHLFSYAGEHEQYSPGNHRLVFQIGAWRICPLICYDLRFPVWSRNRGDYDVLIYIANWPSARVEAWTALLRARAIENLAYTIGLNRIGADDNNITYPGRSLVADMSGKVLHESGDKAELIEVSLDPEALRVFRSRYQFLADRDNFFIE